MLYTITIRKLISNISNCDWLSKNDLFVTINLGKSNRRTTVKWNDNHPEWNESFLFEIEPNENTDYFLLTINDDDKYSKSESIISERIKINKGSIINQDTDNLSISHGITNYKLNNTIDKLNDELSNFNIKYKELEKKNKKYENIIKNTNGFLFNTKKNIIKILSENDL